MARCRFGWTKGGLHHSFYTGNGHYNGIVSCSYAGSFMFSPYKNMRMKPPAVTVETETGKNNSSEEKPIQTGCLHILALMQKPRAVRTHCIASFLSQFVLALLFFPDYCFIKALTVKRAWPDMSGTRLCSGMRLWSWRFFSCVQCTKVQPWYKLAEGKYSSGEFCLVSEELVQVSSKGCVCTFLLLMQF